MIGGGALVAQVAFWGLVAWGLLSGELSRVAAVAFVAAWLGSRLLLSSTSYGAPLTTSVVAVLDIALVLMILKRDVRLS